MPLFFAPPRPLRLDFFDDVLRLVDLEAERLPNDLRDELLRAPPALRVLLLRLVELFFPLPLFRLLVLLLPDFLLLLVLRVAIQVIRSAQGNGPIASR